MKNYRFALLSILLLFGMQALADEYLDDIYLTNGDHIKAEIKKLEKKVLEVKTDYSKSNFTMDWDDIAYIKSPRHFIVIFSNGDRRNGSLYVDSLSKNTYLLQSDSLLLAYNQKELATIYPYELGFWKKFSGYVDFGYNKTKSNNTEQLNFSTDVKYQASTWSTGANSATVYTRNQDETTSRRTDGALNVKIYLVKSWFNFVTTDFLHNDDQNLDLRTTGMTGLGNYIVQSRKVNLGVIGGAAWTNESFLDASPNKESFEGVAGFEFNTYDMDFITISTNLTAYPGITIKDRFRLNYKLDFKFDIIGDLYFKINYTLNFDNKPSEGAAKNDYVIITSLGLTF